MSERLHTQKSSSQVELMREVVGESDRTIKRARATSSAASSLLGNAPEIVYIDSDQETVAGDVHGDCQDTLPDTQIN